MSPDDHETEAVDDRSAAVAPDTLVATARSRRSASERSTARPPQRRSRWLTIGLPATAAAAVAVTLWAVAASRTSPPQQVASSAACGVAIAFDGVRYLPVEPPQQAQFVTADRLGTGEVLPCNDTGLEHPTEAGDPVEVYRVEGLDPRDGVAVAGLGDGVVGRGDAATSYLVGAFISHRPWSYTAGFQRFLETHGVPASSNESQSSSSSLPPPRSSVPGRSDGVAPTTMATSGPATAPATPPDAANGADPRCPATTDHPNLDQLPAPARPLLPTVPAKVVVCRYPVAPNPSPTSTVISERATLQRLTDAFAALRSPGSSMTCTAEKGADLALLVGDGSAARPIWVELYGCGIVTDGTNVFIGGRSLDWLATLR